MIDRSSSSIQAGNQFIYEDIVHLRSWDMQRYFFPAGVERLFGGHCPLVEEINTVTCHHKTKGVPVKALFSSSQSQRIGIAFRWLGSRQHPSTYCTMMMATEYYVFNGGVVPWHVTHVLIDKALKFVPARAFEDHPNIQEVICHDGVVKIESGAFRNCPSLQRLIMPEVKVIEERAFNVCTALTYVECGKLVRIGAGAFSNCRSLSSIDLPSIKIVENWAFDECTNLINAKFGKDLESFGEGAFNACTSLERISLPLKDGVITADDIHIFNLCFELTHIDLVEGEILDETIAALLLEEWKDNMKEEIDAILPSGGGKAQAIRTWIRSVLRKIIRYKAEHQRYLNEAAVILQPALPNDILFKNILPFLELPPHTFDGED